MCVVIYFDRLKTTDSDCGENIPICVAPDN